jgi:hypothetical protein
MKNTMKAKNSPLILAVLALSLAAVSGYAQSQPSSKVTAKTANLTLLPPTTTQGQWQTVLANSIKLANNKDLFINACFEVGLYTDTLVRSKLMVSDTSTAKASVKVRVVLDLGKSNERVVEPGEVVYGRRHQTLSATLEGAIAGCLSIVTNLDGSLGLVLDPVCVQPEEIQLILDTMDAASFSFVAVDVPQGIHTVSVQAQIDSSGTVQNGTFEARALVGKGAVTVESVRLIKDPKVVLDVP